MIGKLIKKFREERGWSQRDLAREMGLKQPMVARWETEDQIPEKESIAKLAKAFGVDSKVFYTLPPLDNKEVDGVMKTVAKLDTGKQQHVDLMVNSLLYKTNDSKDFINRLKEKIELLPPTDQVFVQGLVRRLSDPN